MNALLEIITMCHMCAWYHRGQKLGSDVLGPGLLIVMTHHMGAKIKPQFSIRITSVHLICSFFFNFTYQP